MDVLWPTTRRRLQFNVPQQILQIALAWFYEGKLKPFLRVCGAFVIQISMPGLDGGTYITRSDVLRGQSWNLASEDSRRSTRGGCISASHVYKPKQLDRAEQRFVTLRTC